MDGGQGPSDVGPPRRRPGHKSCVSCKAIKMRCVRETDDAPCERCIERRKECILPEKMPRKQRRGNHLDLAKTLYGLSRETSISSPADVSWTRRELPQEEEISISTPAVQKETAANDEHLSETSAANSLIREETYSWLSSHLIEEYFVASQYPLPVGSWRDFRAQFEQAGRRPAQLRSATSEVMAALLMAYGALVRNAPVIVGSGLPASSGSDVRGYELRQFGRSRAGACEALTEHAMRLADEKGLFRRETAESLSILLMFSRLLDHDDPQRKRGRPYRVSAVGHAKAIAEERDPPNDYRLVNRGPLGWMLY